MIRQWQELIYARQLPFRRTILGPDWLKLGRRIRRGRLRARKPEEGRRRNRCRPGRRRPGPCPLHDRRGAQNVPDDAGRKGPVGPARWNSSRSRRMSPGPVRSRTPADPATPAPAHTAPPARASAGPRRGAPHVWWPRPEQARRPQRVASLTGGANFNYRDPSPSVHTDQPEVSRMTLTLRGDDVPSSRRQAATTAS